MTHCSAAKGSRNEGTRKGFFTKQVTQTNFFPALNAGASPMFTSKVRLSATQSSSGSNCSPKYYKNEFITQIHQESEKPVARGSSGERSDSCLSVEEPRRATDSSYPGEYSESKMNALKHAMLSQSPNNREILRMKAAKQKRNLVSQSLTLNRATPEISARKLHHTEPDEQ